MGERMKKQIGFLTLFIIIIMLLNLASSENPVKRYSPEMVHFGYFLFEHNLYGARFVLKSKQKITLSDSQEKKIENLLIYFEEYVVKEQSEIKIMELKFVYAMKFDKIDRKMVAENIRKISRRKTDFSVNYLNYLLDIKEILNAKQLTKLKQIRRSFRQPERRPPDFHRIRRNNPDLF